MKSTDANSTNPQEQSEEDTPKKLRLTKEMVRVLSTRALEGVHGGMICGTPSTQTHPDDGLGFRPC
jgi:hypothetical protein